MMRRLRSTAMICWGICLALPVTARAAGLQAGSAAVDLQPDDTMVIGGGITGVPVSKQDGRLRVVAVVVGDDQGQAVAIVACDILMIEREFLDRACDAIQKKVGIPPSHVLINCTHTHHAPSTVTVHGYERVDAFCQQVEKSVVQAVEQAFQRMKSQPVSALFWLGEESSVGQNSRLLLADGTIFWTGTRDDVVRPTGPFDPELPVLAFRRADGGLEGVLFNHSTHTIGTVTPGARSPGFYGLAAQELEAELGGTFVFLEGASGSTHNLVVPPAEMILRIKGSVKEALGQARPVSMLPLRAIKREFEVKVRQFDEAREDAVVRAYCSKRIGSHADLVADVFRKMRATLAPEQGKTRKTWLQVIRMGDVAWVGVPAEFFTKLGMQIKRRSPFRYTYVAELANDWIGYVPDRAAYDLGGYQTWTGYHSWVEAGTGERIVDEIEQMLHEIQGPSTGS